MKRYRFSVIAVLPMVLLLLSAAGQAGDKQASPWQPFVPAESYEILLNGAVQAIRAQAASGAKDAKEKIGVELAILEGYTAAVQNPTAPRRSMAIRAMIQVARTQGLKELTTFGKAAPADTKVAEGFKPSLPPLADLMEIFRTKAKGGEGLHADLQYHPKLKNLNGMEALIGALGAKKLSDENMNKVAKELPLFAYRVAVVGALTHEYPQERGQGSGELSLKMRDASIAMAEAAQKKDADGVFKAAQTLENSCTQCHSAFRKK